MRPTMHSNIGRTHRPAHRADRPRDHASDRPRDARRGSAILLALVAVGVATLLGLSLAATRDANIAASRNLAHAAAARAAASGAMEVAVDLIEDPSLDLDAIAETDGVLFEGLAVGDAMAKARVRDLLTGLAADGSSEIVEIVVEGTSAGIAQTARAVGRLPHAPGAPTADLDCSEFALLATEALTLEGDAFLGVWRSSPLAILAEPVAYGIADGTRGSLALSPNASLHGTVALGIGGLSIDADSHDEQLADKSVCIPTAIHVPLAALPAERTRRGDDGETADVILDGYIAYDAMPEGDMRVPARAAVTLRGARSFDVGGSLHIERGARMRVEGDARFIVRGNLVLDAASIEVAAGATLAFTVLGDSSIDGAYLGGERSNPEEVRDATGRAAYDGGASRVLVSVAGDGRVSIGEGSVVKGEIYAPEAGVTLATRSAVYGRILGRSVRLGAACAVFYDPALDDRSGWTARTSGIWTRTGSERPDVNENVRAVARLDADNLVRFAGNSGVQPKISPALGALTSLPAQAAGRGLARGRGRPHGPIGTPTTGHPETAFVSLGFDAMKGADD